MLDSLHPCRCREFGHHGNKRQLCSDMLRPLILSMGCKCVDYALQNQCLQDSYREFPVRNDEGVYIDLLLNGLRSN